MDVKEIPALGRPFELGMLYDYRKHNLITKTKIWDRKTIDAHTVSQPQPLCDFEFTSDDTLSAKTAFLNVKGDLKLSIFLGLIEIHRSAKYLENHRQFTRQSRMSFKYSRRTHFKELQIKDVISELQENRRELNTTTATHIVTGMLYGIDAILVFDRIATDNESKQENHKQLEALIRCPTKIPTEQQFDNISCTYHCDIQLGSDPSSFGEAIEFYKTLPGKIEDSLENALPISVWLYPLSKLTNKSLTLYRPINETILNTIQDRLQELKYLKMKCNDLLGSPTCIYDEAYRQKVVELQKSIEKSERELKRQIYKIISDVAPIDLVSRNIGNFLAEFDKSPICHRELDNNISKLRMIINVLDVCGRINQTANTEILSYTFGQFFGDPPKKDLGTTAEQKLNLRRRILGMREKILEKYQHIDNTVHLTTLQGILLVMQANKHSNNKIVLSNLFNFFKMCYLDTMMRYHKEDNMLKFARLSRKATVISRRFYENSLIAQLCMVSFGKFLKEVRNIVTGIEMSHIKQASTSNNDDTFTDFEFQVQCNQCGKIWKDCSQTTKKNVIEIENFFQCDNHTKLELSPTKKSFEEVDRGTTAQEQQSMTKLSVTLEKYYTQIKIELPVTNDSNAIFRYRNVNEGTWNTCKLMTSGIYRPVKYVFIPKSSTKFEFVLKFNEIDDAYFTVKYTLN